MKYFNVNGRVHAYEADGSQDAYIPEGALAITEQQALDMTAPPPPTPEELFQFATDKAQQRLDDFAKSRGYDGILSLCTYAADPDPVYAAEGLKGVTARSITWAAMRAIKAEVLAGQRPLPTEWASVEAELPPLTWD